MSRRSVTLSEIESTIKKVAQAKGLSWGLAEEAGKSARWLSAYDYPGAEIAFEYLSSIDSEGYALAAPDATGKIWKPRDQWQCPIASGAALSDRVLQLISGGEIMIQQIKYPLLVCGILGQAARVYVKSMQLCWEHCEFVCHAEGITVSGGTEQLIPPHPVDLLCRCTAPSEPEVLPHCHASKIETSVWQQIDQIAALTYAPATEQSRAGAGAGLTDND